MTNPNETTRKATVSLVALAAVLLGAAGLAAAKPPKKFFPKKFAAKKWSFKKKWHPTKKLPPWHWRTRIVRPAPVRQIVVSPTVVRSVVTAPPASPAAEELKAEIAGLKDRYAQLAQTREALRKWLDGPGKQRSEAERAKVRTRLANVDEQCGLVAVRIAKLEQELADV